MKKTVAVLALTMLVACAPPARVTAPPQTSPPPQQVAEPAVLPVPLTPTPPETAEPPLALVGYSAPQRACASDSDDTALVKELIEILNTTQSKDTFAVTAATLVFTKNSRQALPAVIRNGERLGAFEGLVRRLSSGNEPSPTDMGTAIVVLGLLKPEKEMVDGLKGLAEMIQTGIDGPSAPPQCVPTHFAPGVPPGPVPASLMPANLVPPPTSLAPPPPAPYQPPATVKPVSSTMPPAQGQPAPPGGFFGFFN